MSGERSPVYKGGRVMTPEGYVKILRPNHPNAMSDGYVMEHILVMSEVLGRPIDTAHELVHHREEPKWNNDPENLQVMTRSEHMRLHQRMRKNTIP